jgi:DNA-binding transcriptional ArsR family regulator
MDTIGTVRYLEALGNPTRLSVYRLLMKTGPEDLAFGQIQSALGGASSTLSHHVATLARAGLIAQERRGREVVSTNRYDVMHTLLDYLTAECCQGVSIQAEKTNAVA